MNKTTCGKCKNFRLYLGAKYDGFCTAKAGSGILSYSLIKGCKKSKAMTSTVSAEPSPRRCKEIPDPKVQQRGIIHRIRSLFDWNAN